MFADDVVVAKDTMPDKSRVLSGKPRKRVAVVTCIDCRLTNLVEESLGLERGDAVTIKLAGNTIANEEVFRSLAVAIYGLNVETVYVVGHTDCGMANLDISEFTESIRRAGVPPEAVCASSISEWLGLFSDIRQNVQDNIAKLRQSRVIPDRVRISGFVIDSDTGKLEEIQETDCTI